MKCLSLTQPWATLVAIGAKKVETRSWRTHYRGRIYIHAAKAFPKWAQYIAQETRPFSGVLNRPNDELPLGCLIATAKLVDCVPTAIVSVSEQERAFGDYSIGRWAWFLEDIESIQQPIPWRGQLGLFTVEIP